MHKLVRLHDPWGLSGRKGITKAVQYASLICCFSRSARGDYQSPIRSRPSQRWQHGCLAMQTSWLHPLASTPPPLTRVSVIRHDPSRQCCYCLCHHSRQLANAICPAAELRGVHPAGGVDYGVSNWDENTQDGTLLQEERHSTKFVLLQEKHSTRAGRLLACSTRVAAKGYPYYGASRSCQDCIACEY
jgi:hypothetical protein